MANYTTYEYDPGQVDVNVNGLDVSGYADGEFVKVMRNADQAALVVGADGDNTVVQSQNRSGRISITLQQASPLNDTFNAIADAWEKKSGGVVPILVKDNQGTSIHSAKQCWIVKRPDSAYAKESQNREWIFETGNLVMAVGGNSLLS